MSSVHETAYPRFKPELTQRELEDVYTPRDEDHQFGLIKNESDIQPDTLHGDYTLDLDRKVPPMNYKTRIL